MKTYKDFIIEAKLRMISVGPSRSPVGRQRQQAYNSERAAFKKAGVRRSRPAGTVENRPNRVRFNAHPSEYSSTAITSFPHQSSYAKDALKSKIDDKTRKVVPTAERVRFLKRLKKQLGNRSNRQVHNVDILPRKDYKKNDPAKLITRGKEYHKAVKEIPDKIKSTGGKSGDKVVGKAVEVLSGSKDVVKGRKKRERLYSKVLGASKRDSVTNVQSGTVK